MGGRADWRIGGWFAIAAVLSAYPPIRLSAQSPPAANPERPSVATHTVALVPAVTLPSGDQSLGLGAGRLLGSLLAVWSFELGGLLHTDLNAGPVGIGAGRPQALGTASFSRALGRWGVAAEVYGYTSGGAGAGQGGLLGAVTVRPAVWLVVDGGGVVGLGAAGRDQLFLGVTTNLGRIFK